LADDCALVRVKEVTAIEAMRSRSWVAVVALRANALRLHGELIDQPCWPFA
jgi:hypothetical protein